MATLSQSFHLRNLQVTSPACCCGHACMPLLADRGLPMSCVVGFSSTSDTQTTQMNGSNRVHAPGAKDGWSQHLHWQLHAHSSPTIRIHIYIHPSVLTPTHVRTHAHPCTHTWWRHSCNQLPSYQEETHHCRQVDGQCSKMYFGVSSWRNGRSNCVQVRQAGGKVSVDGPWDSSVGGGARNMYTHCLLLCTSPQSSHTLESASESSLKGHLCCFYI